MVEIEARVAADWGAVLRDRSCVTIDRTGRKAIGARGSATDQSMSSNDVVLTRFGADCGVGEKTMTDGFPR